MYDISRVLAFDLVDLRFTQSNGKFTYVPVKKFELKMAVDVIET